MSFEPDAMSAFDGCHTAHFTSHPCDLLLLCDSASLPINSRSNAPRSKSQILTVASSAHEQNFKSVGQKETSRTPDCGCASVISLTLCNDGAQYLMTPSASADTIHSPVCE